MNLWWKIQLVVLLKLIFKSTLFINYAASAVNASMGLDNFQWFFIGSSTTYLNSLRQGSVPDNYTTTTAAGQGTTTLETYPPLLYISHYPVHRQNNTLEANRAMALANVLILPANDPERINVLRTLGKRPRIGNMLYDWIKDLNDTKLRTIDPKYLFANTRGTTQKPNTLPPQIQQELSSKIDSGWSVYDYKASNWDEMKKIQEKMKSKSTTPPTRTTEAILVTLFKPDPPVVAKARKVMAHYFVGYLSAFMATLCEIIGTQKEGDPAVELAKGASTVVTELSDGGYLADIGQATRHGLEDYINALTVMKADQVDALTEKCTQMFRDHSYLENDTQEIIEDIESWYTMDEGEDLFATLVIVDGFPENKMSSVDVVRKVVAAILQPYYRIEASTNSKVLHIIMLIEAAVDKRTMYLRSNLRSKRPIESDIRHIYSVTKAYKKQKYEHVPHDDVERNKKYYSDNNRRSSSNTYDLDNIEYKSVDDDDITIEELSKTVRNNKNAEITLNAPTALHRFIKSHGSTNLGMIPINRKSVYVTKVTEFNSMKPQKYHDNIQRKFYENFLDKKETRRKGKRLLLSNKNVLNEGNAEVLSYSDERYIKFNLNDAVRHGGIKTMSDVRTLPKENKENVLSSDVDEEGIIKTSIYRAVFAPNNN